MTHSGPWPQPRRSAPAHGQGVGPHYYRSAGPMAGRGPGIPAPDPGTQNPNNRCRPCERAGRARRRPPRWWWESPLTPPARPAVTDLARESWLRALDLRALALPMGRPPKNARGCRPSEGGDDGVVDIASFAAESAGRVGEAGSAAGRGSRPAPGACGRRWARPAGP